MENEYTQYQTAGDQMRAEELSRLPTVPPSQIAGYRIDRMLGRGAFGQVWVGVDRNTGRSVAIKFYLHHSKMDWKLLSREVRHLVSMAADRNVVQVLAVGWDHEPPYYVMEYLENGSLDQLIKQQNRLSVTQSLAIFLSIASALKHSHGRGILHCDLKPANILLDPQMQPRLADFGQSRMSNDQTPSLGTLFYMAPEQADLNAMPDARWDVYALGAILHCMLTGAPPYFSSENLTTLKTANELPERLSKYRQILLSAPPPKQLQRVPGVDKPLLEIVEQMLARKIENRFDNVQQVLDAFARRARNRVRKPLLLLGVVGPLLLLCVMSLFFWRGISTAKNQSTVQLQMDASRSNGFAASLAARTMERDISTLYQLIEAEAAKSALQIRLTAALEDFTASELAEMVAQSPRDQLLQKVLNSENRVAVENYLQETFDRFNLDDQIVHDTAKIDSMFILDNRGTMLAAAFAENLESKVGWNFAYRSYFNGAAEDRKVDADRENVRAYAATHLSPPFKSTTTDRWKIAIATPIFSNAALVPDLKLASEIDSTDVVEQRSAAVVGVLVMTINLGDFELLGTESNTGVAKADSKSQLDLDRFAVLIDGRPGNREGTLVQHPLLGELADQRSEVFSSMNPANQRSPATLQIDEVQLSRLRNGSILDYRDPAANHPEGKQYLGDWIATLERIKLPLRSEAGGNLEKNDEPVNNRGLLVLVQEPARNTAVPVQQLVNAMTREFAIAMFVVLAVICSLWYFGLRMFPSSELTVRDK